MALSQITAYNVGFGDCLLLKFADEKADCKPSFLLLDCGSTEPDSVQWDEIAADIASMLNQDNCKNISFMLTHPHDDHCNGFRKVYEELTSKFGISVDTMYLGAIINDTSFDNKVGLLPNVLVTLVCSADNLFRIDSSVRILWPPAPIEETEFQEYFTQVLPGVHQELRNLRQKYKAQCRIEEKCKGLVKDGLHFQRSFGKDHMNAMSVVFEAEGVNKRKYLFTGDFMNSFKYTAVSEPKYDVRFDLIQQAIPENTKYKMIKMPHHGTETWPLDRKLFASDGYSLISWSQTPKWRSLNFDGFPNAIATNYPTDSINPPYPSNVFKIQIDIAAPKDHVTVYEKGSMKVIFEQPY